GAAPHPPDPESRRSDPPPPTRRPRPSSAVRRRRRLPSRPDGGHRYAESCPSERRLGQHVDEDGSVLRRGAGAETAHPRRAFDLHATFRGEVHRVARVLATRLGWDAGEVVPHLVVGKSDPQPRGKIGGPLTIATPDEERLAGVELAEPRLLEPRRAPVHAPVVDAVAVDGDHDPHVLDELT